MTRPLKKKMRRAALANPAAENAAKAKERARLASYEEKLGFSGDGRALWDAIRPAGSGSGKPQAHWPDVSCTPQQAAWAEQAARDALPSRWAVVACSGKEPDDFPECSDNHSDVPDMFLSTVVKVARLLGLADGITKSMVLLPGNPDADRFARALLSYGAKLLYDGNGVLADAAEPLFPADAFRVKTVFDELDRLLGLPDEGAYMTVEVNVALPEDVMREVSLAEMSLRLPAHVFSSKPMYHFPDHLDMAHVLTFGRERLVTGIPNRQRFGPFGFGCDYLSEAVKGGSEAWAAMDGQSRRLEDIGSIWERFLKPEDPDDEFPECDLFAESGAVQDGAGDVDVSRLWEYARDRGVEDAVRLYLSGKVELEDILA